MAERMRTIQPGKGWKSLGKMRKDWSLLCFKPRNDYSLEYALAGPAAAASAIPKPRQGAILPPTGKQRQEVGLPRCGGIRGRGLGEGATAPSPPTDRRQAHSNCQAH